MELLTIRTDFDEIKHGQCLLIHPDLPGNHSSARGPDCARSVKSPQALDDPGCGLGTELGW